MSLDFDEPVACKYEGYFWPALRVREGDCSNKDVLAGKSEDDFYLCRFFGEESYSWYTKKQEEKKAIRSAYDYNFRKETTDAELVYGLENALDSFQEFMSQPEFQAKKRARDESKKKKGRPRKRRKIMKADEEFVFKEKDKKKKKKPRKKKSKVPTKKRRGRPKTTSKVRKPKIRKKKLKKVGKDRSSDNESDLELDEDEGLQGSSSDEDLQLDDSGSRFNNMNDNNNSADYLEQRMKEYESSSEEEEESSEEETVKKKYIPPPSIINFAMSNEEIVKAKKKIEEYVTGNKTKEILRWIGEISSKTQDLKQFKIYKFPKHLNTLRKQVEDKECQKQFKELLFKWKKDLQQLIQIQKMEEMEEKKKSFSSSGNSGNTEKMIPNEIEETCKSAEGLKFSSGHKTRDYSAKLLASGLFKGGKIGTPNPSISGINTLRCIELGHNIESECYSIYNDKMSKQKQQRYLRQIRAIYNNCKFENSDLAKGILEGSISPLAIATMEGKDMTSREKILEKKKLWDQKMHMSRVAEADEIKGGVIDCEKCGSNKTTYNELQTRSADESMTVFVTCHACGYKFKKG